jgi:hypothetical protein
MLATALIASVADPGLSDRGATSQPGLGSLRGSTRVGGKSGSAVSANRVIAICGACSWPGLRRHPLCQDPRHRASPLVHGVVRPTAEWVAAIALANKDRADGLGHDGQGRALQMTSSTCAVKEIASNHRRHVKVWEGQQHVIQSRSIRRSGQPTLMSPVKQIAHGFPSRRGRIVKFLH